MFLSELLDAVASERDLASSTLACFYRPALSSLKQFCSSEPTLEDLDRQKINAWIQWQLAKKTNARTIDRNRRAILSLWRDAYQNDLLSFSPDRVKKIKKAPLIVQAWTEAEIVKLLKTIENTGKLKGLAPKYQVSNRDFYWTLVAVGYQTGLRLGDLLAMERSWIRVDSSGVGFVSVVQNKTNRVKTSRIDAETMKRVDALIAQQPNRRLIWPMGVRREALYRMFRAIVKESGIRKGTFRWIRRSGVTHVERDQPGRGWLHAGHSDPRTAMLHYLDRSQLTGVIVSPTLPS